MINFNWLPQWIQKFNFVPTQPAFQSCTLCGKDLPSAPSITYLCEVCYQDIDLYPLGYDLSYHNPKVFQQLDLDYVAGLTAISDYHWPIEQLLKNLKFHQQPFIARIIADLMFQQLENLPWSKLDRIASIPLHTSRELDRGYNQSQVITEFLNRKLSVTPFAGLERVKKTQPQTELNRRQRKQNLNGAFNCRQDISGQTILLIDDVLTTGTTINQASKVLKESGASEVYVAVAAIRSL